MLYQCTNIPYCLSTVALMVIKQSVGGIFYDVTVIFHITTIKQKAARGKKRCFFDCDFRLRTKFLGRGHSHVVFSDVGQGGKKSCLTKMLVSALFFLYFALLVGFCMVKNV